MKLLAKPISSPARVTTTDNFPPPLLRFLKTHGDSKSRRSTSRSRSSPIFITKRNQIQAQVEVEEPSSPEVTCMGQVHVRSNKRSNQAKKRKKNKKKERASISGYQWIRKKLFCCTLKRSGSLSLRLKREEKPEELQEEEKVEVFVTKAPPKNALLLMRCRSEPYRASSLANRFWGSPPETEQQKQSVEDEETEHHTLEDEPEPPSCRDSAVESKTDLESEEEKVGFCEGLESSSTRSGGGGGVRPLLLTRCQSEPARRSEKFEGFWKKRLGFVDISNTRF